MAARSANARKKGTKTSARKEDVKMEITKTVTVTTTSEPASNFGVADRIYARSTSVWSPSQGIPVTSDDVAGHEFAGLSPAIFSPPTLNTKSSSITSAARLSSSSDETTMGSSASATRARQTWKNVTKSSHVPTITRAEMLTNGHRLVEIKPGENEKPVFVLLKRGKKGPQTCHLKDTDGKARGEITLDDADFEDYPVGMEQNHSNDDGNGLDLPDCPACDAAHEQSWEGVVVWRGHGKNPEPFSGFATDLELTILEGDCLVTFAADRAHAPRPHTHAGDDLPLFRVHSSILCRAGYLPSMLPLQTSDAATGHGHIASSRLVKHPTLTGELNVQLSESKEPFFLIEVVTEHPQGPENQQRRQLAQRNLLAMLHRKSLAGRDIYETLLDLLVTMHHVRGQQFVEKGGRAVGAITEYIIEKKMYEAGDDIDTAIGLLAFAENVCVRSPELYRLMLPQCLGKLPTSDVGKENLVRLSSKTRERLWEGLWGGSADAQTAAELPRITAGLHAEPEWI